MAPRKRTTRLYRLRGRFYGDFRDFADVGGKREALTAPGESFATTDADVAAALSSARVKELERKRHDRVLLGVTHRASIDDLAERYVEHLRELRRSESHIKNAERRTAEAIAFFGPGRFLDTIGVRDVRAYMAHLNALPGRMGETLSPTTVRGYLVVLSGLFSFAAGEEAVRSGQNPVRDIALPSPARFEAPWLEVHEAAVVLEAARRTEDAETHAMIALFLLTGGRKAEVLGLQAPNLSFDRRTVLLPGRKTRGSYRTVPMWPQLAAILEEYLEMRGYPAGRVLTRGWRMRARLDRIARASARLWVELHGDRAVVPVAFRPGGIRTRIFRHTYTAARLQTLDRGEPVSVWTVSRELGHASTERVERVYGHLGSVRHRSEVVEYRLPEKETVGV